MVIYTFLDIEVIDGRYVLVRGSAHPPVIKNGGALRIDRISSGPIIGGRPRAPRVHLLYRRLWWNPGMILIIRSVVLCDIVDNWCRGHLVTLEEAFLDCSQQFRVYLY